MTNGINTGIHFGLTSGVITTLGLIVGLHSGTHSTLAVIGGIFTIAVADAMSDALGIHISKEAENSLSGKQLWLVTVATFLTKFAMAGTFIIPILLLPLTTAIVASVIWGMSVLALLSFMLARSQRVAPLPVVAEHVGIALVVVVITHFIGEWVSEAFS
jgi:VIT1/CCC1 family predicted Fe2+/Mn2+ transporter